MDSIPPQILDRMLSTEYNGAEANQSAAASSSDLPSDRTLTMAQSFTSSDSKVAGDLDLNKTAGGGAPMKPAASSSQGAPPHADADSKQEEIHTDAQMDLADDEGEVEAADGGEDNEADDDGDVDPEQLDYVNQVSEEEENSLIRAKWTLDGCDSMDSIINRLGQLRQMYIRLKKDGWEVTQPIFDDYGAMKQKKTDDVKIDT